VGYGFNWVPFRGFVVNAMAMPTLSVYNRVKVYKYDFNYMLDFGSEHPDDYGEWNPETRRWANGERYKPLDSEDKWLEDVECWETDQSTSYGRLQLNIDVRLGIAYNWSRYFAGMQLQMNRFSYKQDATKVTIIDAWGRVSLGVRL
jgi:hypothetical protein